jgi:two-component system, OmpR family, sensor histidine kinase VicK
MEGQLAAPFHFAVEFLILVVFAGAMFDALRSSRESGGRVAVVQAAGFASLVAAQIFHGTLVFTGDGVTTLVVLRAVGFGLIAASLRPMPAAALPAVFVAGEGSAWAWIPAAFAVIAAGRAFAMRKESAGGPGLALAGSFAAFAGGEAAVALASPEGGAALGASHGLRALGAVLLARWLWLSIARSLRLRFIAVFIAALVLLASVVAGALTQVIGHNLQQEEFNRLAVSATGQKGGLELRKNQALQFANLLGSSKTISDAYASGTSAALTEIARASISQLPADLDFVAFFRGGRMIASATDGVNSYPPLTPLQGIALSGSDAINTVLKKRTVASELTSSGDRSIAAIGAASVTDPAANRKIIGAVVVGYNLDHQLLTGLKPGASADIHMIKGGAVISTTFESEEDAAGLVAGGLRDRIRRTVEEQGRNLTAVADTPNGRQLVVYSPIATESGARIAGVMALSRPGILLDASQRSVNRVLFLVTLAASAIAAAMAWILSGRATGPISALTRAARQIRSGDLEARAEVSAPDEVGALGQAFNQMAESLDRMTGDLRNAAAEEANLRVRVESIMQSIGDALVATDEGGNVVAVNRAAEAMLGRDQDDLVGRPLHDVLDGRDGSGRPLAELALEANGARVEAVVESSSGAHVPVALSGSALRDASGTAVGRVVLLRDITREQEAERMKSEFLSNVSHELRTPLTPIKGYTEILRRKNFPRAKAETFLEGIAESTKRLERIVEILVDFAALEAGRLKPRLEPVDVRSFLADVLAPFKERSDHRRFTKSIHAGLPPVLGDERLLRKCVAELIDNAIKFSPDGGSIEIGAEAVPVNGRKRGPGSVRIMVRDHGIGIDPSQMGRLFQDFRQLDGSETRSFGGLGLGLSYAKRVALAHQGDITAESEPGRGSTFSVVLPAVQPAKAVRPRRAAGDARIRKTRPISRGTRTDGRKRVAAAAKSKRKKPSR